MLHAALQLRVPPRSNPITGFPEIFGSVLAQTRSHSDVVIKGCDSTGSPGRFNLYCRKVLAARSLSSADLCSLSSARRKCGLTAATGFTLKTSSKDSHRSGSAWSNATCVALPLPAATVAGHQLAGPVNGAGAKVPIGGSDSNGAESHVKDASAVGSQGGILSGPSAKDVRSGSIVERWDELLRVAGSLKLGWVTASLLISKLQAGARENVLSRALRDLGRLVKTQFILQWIESEDYRRRIHRQLNKGEALHALRRFLFFAHEGKVQRRQADQQTNQVLCLNLVTNAIVTWSTLYMNAAIEQLRAEGSIGPDVGLGHLSPALYGHINPYGKYRFEIADRPADLRPLRSPENGP